MKEAHLHNGAISPRLVAGVNLSTYIDTATPATTLHQLRDVCGRQLADFGKLLHERHYVSGCDGNLSVRLSSNYILITPTGLSKRLMEPADMVMTDLEGRKVDGVRKPSSEIGMHLTIYKLRPDVGAIVHAHPCVATGFACAGHGLTEPVCSELLLTLGAVPLARYAPPGSRRLSHVLEPLIPIHDAILLQNHGVITYSENLERAYLHMETVEHCANIMLASRLLGGPVGLSHSQAKHLNLLYALKKVDSKQSQNGHSSKCERSRSA